MDATPQVENHHILWAGRNEPTTGGREAYGKENANGRGGWGYTLHDPIMGRRDQKWQSNGLPSSVGAVGKRCVFSVAKP